MVGFFLKNYVLPGEFFIMLLTFLNYYWICRMYIAIKEIILKTLPLFISVIEYINHVNKEFQQLVTYVISNVSYPLSQSIRYKNRISLFGVAYIFVFN